MIRRSVLALVADPCDPSARHRIVQFVAALGERARDVTVRAIPGGGRERRRLFRSAREFDTVFWQRRLLPPWHAAALRAAARRLVFDFDDALPYRDSFRGATLSLSRRTKFRAAVRRADAVVAANAELARLAGPFARRVEIVPTVVDPARAVVASHGEGDEPVAGWIGSASTRGYLRSIGGPLREVARTIGPRFRFVVVADALPAPCDPFFELRPWTESSEASDVARLGVGVAPLTDDAWARGKSGLKLLQYAVAGLPAVASDVGVQCEIVRDGVSGFLARTSEEWVDRLVRLLRSPALRAEMGRAARSAAIERYSIGMAADRLAAIL